MLRSLKISGFKNFRGRSIEITNLKRINLLVGVNGSGKSSVLELLTLSSRFHRLDSSVPTVGSDSFELNSLFGPETQVGMSFDNDINYLFKLTPRNTNNWPLEKEGSPEGSMEVMVIWRVKKFSEDGDIKEKPFGNIRDVKLEDVQPADLENAQRFLQTINPRQRLFNQKHQRLQELYYEGENEIWPQRLAGGDQYIGMLIRAIQLMPQGERPASLLLIDDLGDSIFPALRKAILPMLKGELEKHPPELRAQLFATTHNIEIVKAALENPDYCNVYMFDYDGSLIDFNGSNAEVTNTSSGIKSVQEIPLIAKMLGLTDLDLGFPELVIFAEEETKRTFLNALRENSNFSDKLKKYEVQVPFQQGDDNVLDSINSLLDLSKYFAFSEIWSNRYAIFTDYSDKYYDEAGNVKDGDTQHIKALRKAQEKLILNGNFLITKKGDQVVYSMEDTYPDNLWEEFRHEKSISEASIKEWLAKNKQDKGKVKNDLAEFVGSRITVDIFKTNYPELVQLICK